VKNDKQYEGLREKGMSKERAARIANSKGSSKRGGESSGSGTNRRNTRLLAGADAGSPCHSPSRHDSSTLWAMAFVCGPSTVAGLGINPAPATSKRPGFPGLFAFVVVFGSASLLRVLTKHPIGVGLQGKSEKRTLERNGLATVVGNPVPRHN
jgi:hypothetical protein